MDHLFTVIFALMWTGAMFWAGWKAGQAFGEIE